MLVIYCWVYYVIRLGRILVCNCVIYVVIFVGSLFYVVFEVLKGGGLDVKDRYLGIVCYNVVDVGC